MTRLKELLDLHNAQARAEEVQRREAEEARAAAELAARRGFNAALRAEAQAALGTLFDELVDPDAPDDIDVIPLRLGPGPRTFLTVRYEWSSSRRQEVLSLVARGPYQNKHSVELPASDEHLSAIVGWAANYRSTERKEDWETFEHELAYSDNEPEARQALSKLLQSWPDRAERAEGLLDARLEHLAERARREEAAEDARTQREAQARSAEEAEAARLLARLASDPTALALARMFVEITADRERWQDRLQGAQAAAEEAWSAADRSSSRASEKIAEAERLAERAEREKRDAESRAEDAEAKAKKLARQNAC